MRLQMTVEPKFGECWPANALGEGALAMPAIQGKKHLNSPPQRHPDILTACSLSI